MDVNMNKVFLCTVDPFVSTAPPLLSSHTLIQAVGQEEVRGDSSYIYRHATLNMVFYSRASVWWEVVRGRAKRALYVNVCLFSCILWHGV